MARENIGKKRPPEMWGKVEAMWGSGNYTLSQIAEEFDITPAQIAVHLEKKKVKKGELAEQAAMIVKEQVKQDMIKRMTPEITADRLAELRENTWEWNSAIEKMLMSEIITIKRNNGDIGDALPKVRALKEAIQTLSLGFELGCKTLGVESGHYSTDEHSLPELPVIEMSKYEVLEHKTGIKVDQYAKLSDEDLKEAMKKYYLEDAEITPETV